MPNKIQIFDLPDHPAAEAFHRESLAAAEAMSDEEGWKLHNKNLVSDGLPEISFEVYVKEWL